MWTFAFRCITYQPKRFLATVAGLGVLFLLSLIQIGMLLGWCLTTSEIIWQTDADLWVMAPKTPAMDYGAPIPTRRIYQARNEPGVAWSEGIIFKWAMWQRPDGRLISVEIVGIDRGLAGAPWEMQRGQVGDLWYPDSVIVDAAYTNQLGVEKLMDEVDIYGKRAVVRGICQGVRTFTASPFVFASLNSARRFGHAMADDQVTYVLVRCQPGADHREVADRLEHALPGVEVLTKREFAWRTAAYWMLQTGAGATVVVIAALGLCVSSLVVSQSLYSLTIDALPYYGVLRAVGFNGRKLACIVFAQAVMFAGAGIMLGGLLFSIALQYTENTTISIWMPFSARTMLVFAFCTSCSVASFVPVRTILNLEPASVFRV